MNKQKYVKNSECLMLFCVWNNIDPHPHPSSRSSRLKGYLQDDVAKIEDRNSSVTQTIISSKRNLHDVVDAKKRIRKDFVVKK